MVRRSLVPWWFLLGVGACAAEVPCTRLRQRLEACVPEVARALAMSPAGRDLGDRATAAARALPEAMAVECGERSGRFADGKAINGCLDLPDCPAFAACFVRLLPP